MVLLRSILRINLRRSDVSPMAMPKQQVVPIDGSGELQTPCLEDVLGNNLDGLYRFALRLTGNKDEAQDLTQEAAARAWERQETIVRNARAWLYQTLYNAFISSRRRLAWRRETGVEYREETAECEHFVDPLPAIIATEDVRRALEALPEELRTVVWLSDAEDLRLREIAEIMDWPIGTVASRLWRARQELRRCLSAYGPAREK